MVQRGSGRLPQHPRPLPSPSQHPTTQAESQAGPGKELSQARLPAPAPEAGEGRWSSQPQRREQEPSICSQFAGLIASAAAQLEGSRGLASPSPAPCTGTHGSFRPGWLGMRESFCCGKVVCSLGATQVCIAWRVKGEPAKPQLGTHFGHGRALPWCGRVVAWLRADSGSQTQCTGGPGSNAEALLPAQMPS